MLGVTYSSDFDPNPTIEVSGKVEKAEPGSDKDSILRYTVIDSIGNTTIVDRTITVTNRFPTITGLSDIIIRQVETANLVDGVGADDNEDGDITTEVKYPNEDDLKSLAPGENYVEYKVTDSDGNTTIGRRKIVILQNTFKVNYNCQGGSSIGTSTVEFNNLIPEPQTPTKRGYTFGGWYTDTNFSKKWDFKNDKMPENDK